MYSNVPELIQSLSNFGVLNFDQITLVFVPSKNIILLSKQLSSIKSFLLHTCSKTHMNTFQTHLLAYMGSATMVVHNQCLSTILNCWNVKKIVGLHPTMAIFFSFPSTGLTKTDVYCYTVHKRDTTRCVTRLNCVTPDVLKRLWSCWITTPHVHLSQVSESWHRFDVFVQ